MDIQYESPGDRVAKSAHEFNRALNELGESMRSNFQAVATNAVLRVWREIIQRTPVDTGRARANWQVGSAVNQNTIDGQFGEKNKEPRRDPPPIKTQYDPPLPSAGELASLKDADIKWIFNNLEYIVSLEGGHSRQAPTGMVAESLQMLRQHLEAEVARLKASQ